MKAYACVPKKKSMTLNFLLPAGIRSQEGTSQDADLDVRSRAQAQELLF